MSHLRDLQLRFQDYLLGRSEEIERDIVDTDDARAEHRLGVYYNAYRIRLIDCLAIDYSALEKHLGRERFEEIALAYLDAHPSGHPSVRWVGRQLADFLRHEFAADDAEFLAELAAWEWAQTLVFDAADSARQVELDELAVLPPEAWPGIGFRFKPALRWLDLRWNVPPIEAALDRDEPPPAPVRAHHPTRWLLWRHEFNTRWRSLEVHEAWALEQAAGGADFAAICEGLLEWIDAAQAPLVAAGLLKQWVGDGLLLSLDREKA